MKNLWVGCGGVVFAAVLIGCPAPKDGVKREAAGAATATTETPAPRAAPARERSESVVEQETPPPVARPRTALDTFSKVRDAGLGYEILIPSESAVLQRSSLAHTFSKVMGVHEINIHITNVEAVSLADAVRTATMLGKKTVIERQRLADGYLVVKAPQGSFNQEVWLFRRSANRSVTVKVSGPPAQLERLKTIARSLKVSG